MVKKAQIHCQKADRCQKFDGTSCPRETYPDVNYLCFEGRNLYIGCKNNFANKKNTEETKS